MNDGVIGIVFSLVYVSLKEFGVVGSDTYTWGIKDFHKCWSGSLAKRTVAVAVAKDDDVLPVLLTSGKSYKWPAVPVEVHGEVPGAWVLGGVLRLPL